MDEILLEEAIKRANIDPRLVKLENALPVTVKRVTMEVTPIEEPVKEKKIETFKWQDSLRTLTTLMKTGRPAPPGPPPKKKKVWKWLEQHKQGRKDHRKGPLPCVDYSSVGLTSFDVERNVSPRPTTNKLKTDHNGKFLSASVRFRHNGLTSMTGLDTFLEKRFTNPSDIEWLDLSYNAINEIDPVLSMFPNLKILYLHSNCLDDLDEVRKLRYLPNLQSLTLFGNPIEASVDYRLKIVAAIPSLKRVDWTIITARERELAAVYVKMMEEKDEEEIKELIRQEKAAEERRERRRKAAERKRLRKQEEREAAKGETSEAMAEHDTELRSEPAMKKEVIIIIESSEEITEEEQTEEKTTELEEEMTEEGELEEGSVTAKSDLGPLDVKGKRKLHPDPLSAISLKEVQRVASETSVSSTDTVTIEQIMDEFKALKEMEPNADHNWGSTVRF